MRTICASRVSAPTRSARMTNPPVVLIVAPITRSLGFFSTGIGSPVTIDSSTELMPSTTTPSAGTFSPGLTRIRSPGTTRSSGTSYSPVRCDHTCGLWRQSEERFDRAAGVASSAQLEDLAEHHQRGDRGGGLEVNRHGTVGGAK